MCGAGIIYVCFETLLLLNLELNSKRSRDALIGDHYCQQIEGFSFEVLIPSVSPCMTHPPKLLSLLIIQC